MADAVASGSGASGDRETRKRKHVSGNEDDDGNADDEGDGDDDDDDGENTNEEGVRQKMPKLAIDLHRPAALIVMDRWGSPIHGGIAAALYLLIGLLKTWGLVIHCTVLEADDNTVKEATRLGVNLILPERNSHYKTLRPTYIWLVAHKTFFPQLGKLENLKFVLGFGMVTSSVALDIKDKVLVAAKYFHVNIWSPEELKHDMFNIFVNDKEAFDLNCELLDVQNLRADAVLSIGKKIFEYFHDRLGEQLISHFLLLPQPQTLYFKVPTKSMPQKCNFQILTPFETCFVSELTHRDLIPAAINLVAKTYDKVNDEPPKWKILCHDKHGDSDISKRLKPHSKLTLIIKGFTNITFTDEIRYSHLLIIPPRSQNSLNVTMATIASGKPIIVPQMSEGDYFIQQYFSEYRHNMVVEMRGKPDELKKRIIDIIDNYDMYRSKASQVREIMGTEVMGVIERINSKLRRAVELYVQLPQKPESSSAADDRSTKETTMSTVGCTQSTPEDAAINSQRSTQEERTMGSVDVHLSTAHGNADNGSSMSDVTDRFYTIEGNRPASEGTGRVISNIHDGLEVVNGGKGCLRYVVKCRSLEALEALWSEYISGRLDKTIHSTIITPTLLSKIQAHYLTLDIYIPVQNYLLCKRELPLITGPVTVPSRRHSVAAVTALQTVNYKDPIQSQTIDKLSLILSKIQIQDSKTNSDVLSRDDFRIEELHHFRTTFATKRHKLKLTVLDEESKLGQSERKRDKLRTNSDTESSVLSTKDCMISKFVLLEKHSSKHTSQSKAAQLEAGQNLMVQREFATIQHIREKEMSEASKAMFNQMQSDLEQVNHGLPVRESVLEVFEEGIMPGQLHWAMGIYIKNNGQWVICDRGNHRVQVIDPIKLCCDLILQFHAFPNPFNPVNVTVDEDNDQYFMSDKRNGQVVVSSGQSKILNCFGRKEGIQPTGICLSPDGFIFMVTGMEDM
ncbi:uncharacterized protein [Ptychodera flava]|uniref:uncharacterized protein isoform X2 n=1 Tax=Ptychodera flava TaxID=63121 RepID=UPI003969C9C0